MMWLTAMVVCEGGRMGGAVLHFVIRLETVWEWAYAGDSYHPVLLLMPSLFGYRRYPLLVKRPA
jgi:hypothetical protein